MNPQVYNNFQYWLQQNSYNCRSISNYISGLKTAEKLYNQEISQGGIVYNLFGGTGVKDFDTTISGTSLPEEVSIFITFVRQILLQITNPGVSTKTLYDYRSALHSFEDYWVQNVLCNNTGSFSRKEIELYRTYVLQNCKNYMVTYSKQELINNFKMRLLTQDRVSATKKVFFPIRLMNSSQLWGGHNNPCDQWAQKCAENIYFIIKDQNTYCEIQLKKIVSLSITSKGVLVEMNNVRYQVYTSYTDPMEKVEVTSSVIKIKRINKVLFTFPIPSSPGAIMIDNDFNVLDTSKQHKVLMWHVKPLKVNSLGDLAIDHDIPISHILATMTGGQLLAITKLYKATSLLPITSGNVDAYRKQVVNDPNLLNQYNNIGFPNKEMRKLQKCKLVIMDAKENSKKSDK